MVFKVSSLTCVYLLLLQFILFCIDKEWDSSDDENETDNESMDVDDERSAKLRRPFSNETCGIILDFLFESV